MSKEIFFSEALWSDTVQAQKFPALSGDIEVDVAIMGGGITGISTAYNLAKEGKKVAVLEAKRVGMGTTGSSTGNLYATLSEHLFKVGLKHNDETMNDVATSRNAAVKFIEDRVNEFNIDCEFERVPWVLFTTNQNSPRIAEVGKESEALRKAGLIPSEHIPANFPYVPSSVVNVPDQAQFNPLRYVQQLAASIEGEGCRIYENTKVTDFEDGEPCIVKTNRGTVRAKKVIQATHSPKGIYAVHTAMEVYREYCFAVKLNGPLPPKAIYWHLEETNLFSIRPYSNEHGNFLIVLEDSQKTGHNEHTEQSFKKVEEYMRAHFDVANIEFTWAAQNYKPADSLPYIGTSPTEDNIYIATGFGPDGLVYGTLASIIISDLILGVKNVWAEIYDPKRFTPAASFTRFTKENVDVAAHMVKDHLLTGREKDLEDIKPGEGKVVKLNNEKVAAYRDGMGVLHLVSAVCTHMMCVVHWNNGEKSWDCPCHGSRFSTGGEVLEGPAKMDLPKIAPEG